MRRDTGLQQLFVSYKHNEDIEYNNKFIVNSGTQKILLIPLRPFSITFALHARRKSILFLKPVTTSRADFQRPFCQHGRVTVMR